MSVMAWSGMRRVLHLTLLPGLPIVITVNDFVGGPARIRGCSMAPTLNEGPLLRKCQCA